MESLTSARIRFNPTYSFSYGRRNSTLFPALNPRAARRVFISPTRLVRTPRSFCLVGWLLFLFNHKRPRRWNISTTQFPPKKFLRYGELQMLYALMWIALFAWMRVLMSLPNSVELERLLLIGLPVSGSVPFEQALTARLSIFNLSLSQVQNFLEKRPPELSPGIDALVNKLKDKNKDVYLISDGFRQMINPVASILGIPQENIFANQLLFGCSGEFLRFDANEPTSRSGGKATAVASVRKARGYSSSVMIGDGATDLEAHKPGGPDLFICYGRVNFDRQLLPRPTGWYSTSKT